MTESTLERGERIGILIFRYFRNEITVNEKKELDAWRSRSEKNELAFQEALHEDHLRVELGEVNLQTDYGFAKLQQERPDLFPKIPVGISARMHWPKRLVAAAILIVATGLYFYSSSKRHTTHREAVFVGADGGRKLMNDFNRGLLAGKAGIRFKKNEKGELIYLPGLNPKESATVRYSLLAPTGAELPMILPDGTEIFMNTQSAITYPANLSLDTLRIAIDGEAFLNVPANSGKTYVLSVNGMIIKATAGMFNVNAYPADSASRLTVINGVVSISKSGRGNDSAATQMEAGEQALGDSSTIQLVPNADTAQALAWRNNQFLFRAADIKTIIDAMSRWYDVPLKYSVSGPGMKYHINLPRTAKIEDLIKALREQGVNMVLGE